MKRFPETYQEAHEQAKKYTFAPRAGWIEQGKRTKDNQAILVRRTEVIRLAVSAVRSATIFTALDGWKGNAHTAKREKLPGAE